MTTSAAETPVAPVESAAPADPNLFQAAGQMVGDVGRLGSAWLQLARAEIVLARISVARLLLGCAVCFLLAFATWLFACLALAQWLAGFMRGDLAMLAVAALNVAAIVALAIAMRRWWRTLGLPDSRAALGEIARALT